MARHECCPSTMTVESLADWIQTQKIDVLNHVEKIPLTEEEINLLQKASSLASRQMDKLDDTLDHVKRLIKEGTPYDQQNERHQPVDVTIPPTKGMKVLEANRKHADEQLENGYREVITQVYLIPWPEYKRIVAMDIVGEEWSRYSRTMSADEVLQYGRPILEAVKKGKKRNDPEEDLDL